MVTHPDPVVLPSIHEGLTDKEKAAVIFIHGLGDDGPALSNIGVQFQEHGKLPHLKWVFPTALENRDVMQTAWYHPTPLTPFPSQRPELDDPEDEDGLMQSRKYIEGLVEDLVKEGIPMNRIVVGGFSQGCAMSLLVGLTSTKLAGKLAGIAGLAGYLPLADRIAELRKENGLEAETMAHVPYFLMRGTRDILVPKRYFNIATSKLKELWLPDELLEAHEYEGVGHAISGPVLRDFCAWLERVVGPVE